VNRFCSHRFSLWRKLNRVHLCGRLKQVTIIDLRQTDLGHWREDNHSNRVLLLQLCYNNKQLSAALIVAGWDRLKGGQVYCLPMGGTLVQEKWAADGSGSLFLLGYMDSIFRWAGLYSVAAIILLLRLEQSMPLNFTRVYCCTRYVSLSPNHALIQDQGIPIGQASSSGNGVNGGGGRGGGGLAHNQSCRCTCTYTRGVTKPLLFLQGGHWASGGRGNGDHSSVTGHDPGRLVWRDDQAGNLRQVREHTQEHCRRQSQGVMGRSPRRAHSSAVVA